MATVHEPTGVDVPASLRQDEPRPASSGAPGAGSSTWRRRARRFVRADGLILLALVAWTVTPLVLQIVHVTRHGGSFTGVQTTYAPDFFQYLSWIRDSATHGLIGDHFQLLGSSDPVFLQPMFLASGVLWRLGLGLPLAYLLLWAPVAIGLTFVAFRAYARRHLPQRGEATAALVLGLFFASPAAALASYSVHWWGGLPEFFADGSNSFGLWGYFPRAIAVALLVLLLLRVERLVIASSFSAPRMRRLTAVAAAMGLLIAWLHPWQGVEVMIIVLGIAAWTRPSRPVLLSLGAIAAASALPLLYYEALSHYDHFWRSSQAQSATSLLFSPMVLVVALLPLLAAAALGARPRLAADAHRRLLLLWVAASLITYYAVPSDGAHALDGVALPLSILAVEGWRRLTLSRRLTRAGLGGPRAAAGLAVVAIGICTIPGAVQIIRTFHSEETAAAHGQLFATGDFRAFDYLEHAPGGGGVLASPYIASAVPAYTGRNTFTGDFPWTPHDGATEQYAWALYEDHMPAPEARTLLARTGARFLLVDCKVRTSTLPRAVAPLITSSHRFGCAAVYELRSYRG